MRILLAIKNLNSLALMHNNDQVRSLNTVANGQLNSAKTPVTKYHLSNRQIRPSLHNKITKTVC